MILHIVLTISSISSCPIEFLCNIQKKTIESKLKTNKILIKVSYPLGDGKRAHLSHFRYNVYRVVE